MFAVKGTYNITLTVTDHNGKAASTFQLVNIISAPLVVSVSGPTTGTVNQLLSFTSTVSGGTSPYTYAWAVTGGSPSSGTSAGFSTSFAVKGTYNVTLTVTDHNGARATAFQLVTISPLALTVTIAGTGSGTVNQMLTFSAIVNGGTSPYAYMWAVTGGIPASGTSASFTTSFAVKGTYNVTLTVTDHNGKTASAFALVTITPAALSASISGPSSGTINTSVSFSSTVSGGTAPYTYAWAVTGGSPSSGTASTFSSSFAVKGTYNVTLTVTDHNGKTASAFHLISISSTPLTVSITGPTSGSVNTLLSFSSTVSGGTSPYTYAWAVTGGNPSSGTAASFSTSFAVKGTYNVTLTVTDHNGATKTAFQLVTISPSLLASSVSGPTTGTVNQLLSFTSSVTGGTSPYSYAWAVTGGSPASGTSAGFSTSFAVKGTYNVTLAVTDHNGATNTAFQLVTISPLQLTASISGPASGTVNQVLAFNAVVNGGTSPYTYSWVAVGGSPSSGTLASFSTSFAVKGTYTVNVTVTDHNGAVARAFQREIISPLALTVSINGPTVGNVNTAYSFTSNVSGGTSPYSYAWAVAGGNPASTTAASFTTTFAVKGTYNITLTVTDQNGKTAPAFHIFIITGSTLVASISGPTSGSVNSLLSFTSTVSGGTSPYTYAWTATGGNPASGTASTFSTTYAVKGTYTVSLTVTDHNGASATASQMLNISPSPLTASISGPAASTVGSTLSFTSTVSGGTTPYSYSWTVTGGSPASGTAASFSTSFSTKGTYILYLTVTDHNAAVATAFQMVNISPLALAISAISGPSSTTTGISVTFTVTASGGTQPYTFAWNFGDTTTGTTGTHTYTTPGTFVVTVTVTDHNGATATSAGFSINVIPVTGCQDVDGDGICDNLQTQPPVFSNSFSDIPLGGTTYGTILSRGDQCPTIPCQLTVQEATGGAGILITSGSAGGFTPASISVCGGASILSVGANTQLTVKCGSVTVTVITGAVGVTFVGSGANAGVTGTAVITAVNSITFQPATFGFTAPATNTATISVTINGQTVPIAPGQVTSSPFAIFTVSVVNPQGEVFAAGAVLKFDGKASFSTTGSITNYVWNFGDGTIDTSNIAKLTHTYATSGMYTVTLTITDKAGNTNSQSQTINVLPAPFLSSVTFSRNLFVSTSLVQNFTVEVFNPNSYPVLVNVNVSGNCDTVCPFTEQSGPVLVPAGQTIFISVYHTFSPLDQGATFVFQVKLTFTADTSNMNIATYTTAATRTFSFRVR
jgi:PKD repeat protein